MSALRRVWMYSPMRAAVLKNAKSQFMVGLFLCAKCKIFTDAPEVDHIIPVGTGDWNSRIERLFCDASGLQVLCKECHKKKGEKK